MFIILERPWTTTQIAFLARSRGQYTRPIIGAMVDFRLEDMFPVDVLTGPKSTNILGKLPDIPSAQQNNKYFASVFNDVRIVDNATARQYEQTGDFLVLPDQPSSALWKYTKAPWWEYVVVLDEYQGYIKAPKASKARDNEPSPEEADELIDNYDVNHGKIEVLAPSTITKMQQKHIRESYKLKINRI